MVFTFSVLDQKNQNYQFKLKFDTKAKLTMQNYVENMWCSLFLF